MTTCLVNKHLRHREYDDNHNTRISYHYVNDSLLESRRERPKPEKLPVTRTIKCVTLCDSATIEDMIKTANSRTEPQNPIKLYENSITCYSGPYYCLISPITKEDFDFLCDCNYFTVTVEYSVNNIRMPPMTYTVYGHTQHAIHKDQYIDRNKVDIMWMGLSPERSGMGNQYKIDYDKDEDIDDADEMLACLAPVAITCSTIESPALKERWPDIVNDGNELYYITNRNYYFIDYWGKGMIHSIRIDATRDPERPNYTADVMLSNKTPGYFVGPWSKQ